MGKRSLAFLVRLATTLSRTYYFDPILATEYAVAGISIALFQRDR